jgi:tagatose-1,6-bisphosphate aldolase non-catalytic subunit AgaZ/GatZ
MVRSCTIDGCVFINRLQQMAQYPHRLLLIMSTLNQVKSPYSYVGMNPNRITRSLIMLAGLQAPFLCSETHELGGDWWASCTKFISTTGWKPTIMAVSRGDNDL